MALTTVNCLLKSWHRAEWLTKVMIAKKVLHIGLFVFMIMVVHLRLFEMQLFTKVMVTKGAYGMEDFDLMMKLRRNRIKEKCQNIKTPLELSYFMYLKNRNLGWCQVSKIGSTLLNKYMIKLSDKPVPKNLKDSIVSVQVKSVTQNGRSKEFRRLLDSGHGNTTLVIAVRHPFERLVSAFRDKLERRGDEEYEKHAMNDGIGREIVEKYRKLALDKFGPDYLSAANKYGCALDPDPSRAEFLDRLPTFWEFVQFLLNSNPGDYNTHWRPISLMCSPCSVTFDAILKLDNFQQELKFFTQKHGWDTELSNNPAKDKQNEGDRQNLSAKQIADIYFETLDDQDVKKLYSIFKDDFELFGYEPHQFCYRFPTESACVVRSSDSNMKRDWKSQLISGKKGSCRGRFIVAAIKKSWLFSNQLFVVKSHHELPFIKTTSSSVRKIQLLKCFCIPVSCQLPFLLFCFSFFFTPRPSTRLSWLKPVWSMNKSADYLLCGPEKNPTQLNHDFNYF